VGLDQTGGDVEAMSTIRWGIIGCGDVTEVKSGPAFQKASGSELVAVMRRNAALAADYAERHDVPRWYDDADKLIDDPQVDAVYVATPPGSHLEYALRVARAGKPCYVEKPMARSAIECMKMLNAFDRAGKPLFVAYYRRVLPRFIRVKEIIDAGQLGRITACRYRLTKVIDPNPKQVWRLDPEQSGGGLFLDIGSHVLDLLDHLLGPFEECGGAAWADDSSRVEQSVSLHFRTSSGVVGTGSWNFAGSSNDELLEIEGTEGRLAMQVIGVSPLSLWRGLEQQTITLPDPPHVQQPLIQTVVDELLGGGKCPSTGASAARTSKVMDVALARFYRGRGGRFLRRRRS
jgi:predicted dehydrogenase